MADKVDRRLHRAVWLAVVVVVPLVGLIWRGDDPRPVVLGWQMYSDGGDRAGAVVIDASGDEHRVDVDALLFAPRSELRLEAALIAHLCNAPTDAPRPVAVRVELGSASETTLC